jgi:hypothetical protein
MGMLHSHICAERRGADVGHPVGEISLGARFRLSGGEMTRQATVVLYVMLMIAVVVGVDILFFRNRVGERLMANVGIVLVFGAFYLRFLKHP